MEWGGFEKTEVDERKNIPIIVRVLFCFLVFCLIPLATGNIQQDLTLEKATEKFPTIEVMQEIVGEEIPIKGTHDKNKLNDRVIVQNFSFSPVEETGEIPIENLFAKSRHSISYHHGGAQMSKNIEGNIGQLKVNDFIIGLDYTVKEDHFLEVSYRGSNNKINISGYGVIYHKEIDEEDMLIIEDKVKKIVELL